MGVVIYDGSWKDGEAGWELTADRFPDDHFWTVENGILHVWSRTNSETFVAYDGRVEPYFPPPKPVASYKEWRKVERK